MARLTAKGLEKRGEILAVTDELFRKLGYENTTLRMIANEVNISCGHLEHYFREKKDLIEELSDIFIDGTWNMSKELCDEWKEDPFITYAFAVHLLFLVCSHLPDVRRITIEYAKSLDNQLSFSKRFARHYTDTLDIDEENKARVCTAVSMAFAAQYCALHQYDDQSFSDEVARRTSEEHVRIMCILDQRDKEEADRISSMVCNKIDEYTIERLSKPFTKTYRWYMIEGHPFEI